MAQPVLPFVHENFAAFRLQAAQNQAENRALSGAVLSHDGDFGAPAHGKAHFVQKHFIRGIFKKNVLETDDRIAGKIGFRRSGAVLVVFCHEKTE